MTGYGKIENPSKTARELFSLMREKKIIKKLISDLSSIHRTDPQNIGGQLATLSGLLKNTI